MSANKAVYLMARLTTKGLQPGMIFGGRPELDKMDIAAACSKLPSLHFHLIMAKYCDDVSSALQAMGELQEVMCRNHDVWADMEPVRRTRISAAMIQEFVSARKCGRCKGTGSVTEDTKVVDCKPCQGSGQKMVSANARANACSIPESTWRAQKINEPYQDIMRFLDEVEISALERISRKAS